MSIHYTVQENNLKPGTFYLRVNQGETVDLDNLTPNIVGKTALSGTDVKGVINALIEEVAAALVAGNRVDINGLVSFTTSISGSFDTADDVTITADNVRLNIIAQDARSLETTVAAAAKFTRKVSPVKIPIIKNFFDVSSETYDRYTAGSIVSLKGDHLKFNKANPDEGVFVNDGSTETRLTVYSTIGSKQIDALIPAGLSGTLTVMVRTRYTDAGSIREGSHQQQVLTS